MKVGMKINNSAFGKFGEFIVVYDNQKNHRTLLMNTNPEVMDLYVGAWYLQKKDDEEDWCWDSGQYFGSNFENATNYVLGKDE